MLTDRTFNNKARAKQLISFSGLCYPNNITPTDIDLTIEYHNQTIVLGELKHIGNELPLGQRILLQRYVDNFKKSGKYSIAFVGKHSVSDTTQEVIAAEAIVDEFYLDGKWTKPHFTITAKKLCDWFILDRDNFWGNLCEEVIF